MSTEPGDLSAAPAAALEALDRIRRMADSDFRPLFRSTRTRSGPAEPVYTGAKADPRDPQPLRAGLGRIAREHGWSTSLDVGAVLGRWPELVGPDVAAHCSVEKFEPPVLVVRASSTTWATQLRIMTTLLLDRFERELGSRVVEELTVLGPTQRSWKRGRRSVAGRGPRDTYG